jgi:hypothetical protein
MNRFVLSLLLVGLFGSAAAAQPTIFIVRHAEKAESAGIDPDLSEAGHARAELRHGSARAVGSRRFPDRSRALA